MAKGLSDVNYQSEDSARSTPTAAGADYRLQVVPQADHALEHIDAALRRAEGPTLAGKAFSR